MTEAELERVAYLMAAKNKRESKAKAEDGRIVAARKKKAKPAMSEKDLAEIEAYKES